MTRLPRPVIWLALWAAIGFVVVCGAVLRIAWLADVIKHRGDLHLLSWRARLRWCRPWFAAAVGHTRGDQP